MSRPRRATGIFSSPVVPFALHRRHFLLPDLPPAEQAPESARQPGFFAQNRRQSGHHRRHSRHHRERQRRQHALLKIADNVKIEIDKSAIAARRQSLRNRCARRHGLVTSRGPPSAAPRLPMNPVATFLSGLLLLALFGWYFFTEAERFNTPSYTVSPPYKSGPRQAAVRRPPGSARTAWPKQALTRAASPAILYKCQIHPFAIGRPNDVRPPDARSWTLPGAGQGRRPRRHHPCATSRVPWA